MLSIKGIDISVWQNGLDYAKLKEAGVKFAILRATYSTSKDTQLDNHVKGCKKQGIDIGYYAFSRAMTVEDAVKEARACANILGKYDAPTYPVFFDLEDKDIAKKVSRKVHTDCAIAFCEEMTKLGYYSGIYANPSWLESYYEKDRLVGKYDIWLACWTKDPKRPTRYNCGQVMWQWGIDKIGMDVDGDICFIDYPKKIKAWKDRNNKAEDNKDTKPKEDKPTSDNTKQYKAGDAVILNKTPLYAASSSTKPANYLSGEYFILSESIINGKIRITTPKGNTVCTGWVAVSDLDNKSNTKVNNDLTDVARRVVQGEFGCGQTRVKLLTEAGYDYKEVQKLVNKLYYSK